MILRGVFWSSLFVLLSCPNLCLKHERGIMWRGNFYVRAPPLFRCTGRHKEQNLPLDFQHKLGLALKELRETLRWIKLAQAVPLVKPASKLDPIIQECDELIRIFVASIRTSESKTKKTR
jgi:hypothetical protein